jgi:uncharacterized protein YjbI with pentapeptide repeats
LIPAVLAAAGLWVTHVQKKTEQEIAREKQDQETLKNYLESMKGLLLDKGLGNSAKPGVKRLARTLTLNVLRELTAKRNRQVITFLREAELIGIEPSVVDLNKAHLEEADLAGVYLLGASLKRAKLQGANLQEANLSIADLEWATLEEVNLKESNLQGTYLTRAKLNRGSLDGSYLSGAKLQWAELEGANLNRANLKRAELAHVLLKGASLRLAKLQGANLSFANMENTDLWRANLEGANLYQANLKAARNFWAGQLLKADCLEKATMPDGQTYEQWIKQNAPLAHSASSVKPKSASISDEQASEISRRAKVSAKSTGASLQKVYADLHKQFEVSSYRDLSEGQYEEARRYLTDLTSKQRNISA